MKKAQSVVILLKQNQCGQCDRKSLDKKNIIIISSGKLHGCHKSFLKRKDLLVQYRGTPFLNMGPTEEKNVEMDLHIRIYVI